MSTQTTNLELFKYDPLSDGNQTFNIDTALNDNWDKVDVAVGTLNRKTNITTATLAAGSTSITIQDANITSNSILSFYTSIYGVNPNEVTPATGSVTLTFDAQDSNMVVGVRVDG